MKRFFTIIKSFFRYILAYKTTWDVVPLSSEQISRKLKLTLSVAAMQMVYLGKLKSSVFLKLDAGLPLSEEERHTITAFMGTKEYDPKWSPPQYNPKYELSGAQLEHHRRLRTAVLDGFPMSASRASLETPTRRRSKAADQLAAGGYIGKPGGTNEDELLKFEYEHAKKILELAEQRYIVNSLGKFFDGLHKTT